MVFLMEGVILLRLELFLIFLDFILRNTAKTNYPIWFGLWRA